MGDLVPESHDEELHHTQLFGSWEYFYGWKYDARCLYAPMAPLPEYPMKRPARMTPSQPYLIRPRIYLGPELIVGPGEIALLQAVRDTGSISAAARHMGMNYKRAWYLLDTLKQGFHQPVIEAATGGRGGGGARLTPLGEQLITDYMAIATACATAAEPHVAALFALTKHPYSSDS